MLTTCCSQCPSVFDTDATRHGLPLRRSYVAPRPRSRTSAKQPKNELTCCLIYSFKFCVSRIKDLTPALFCGPTAHPPLPAPLTKPRQPLCGRISGLAGTSSPFFSIAKPLRGCLRGRSGRARGPQATGGRGAARPTPRSRPRRRAGSLWEYGSPPVGARLKVCQHRPRAKFSPKMAAQLQVKHYREKLQDLGGV